MNRIDKSRKGVVFGLMTAEEQQDLRKAQAEGRDIIEFGSFGWYNISPQWIGSCAYWCSDWDKPIGEELVGKWCKVWDSNEKDYKIAKVINVVEDVRLCYIVCERTWTENAKLITDTDLIKKLEEL